MKKMNQQKYCVYEYRKKVSVLSAGVRQLKQHMVLMPDSFV